MSGLFYWPMTPAECKRKFRDNARRAERRGIEWNLTFEQWMDLWRDRIDERGPHKGQYVLCRKNDIGPYAVGNCYVAKGTHNSSVRGYLQTRTNSAAYGNYLDQRQTPVIPGSREIEPVQERPKINWRKVHKEMKRLGLR